MTVYKRNAFGLIKSLGLAVGGAVAVGIIAWVICSFISIAETTALFISVGIAVLILIFMVYSAIFSENIAFELYPDGRFRYIKNGKLQNEYNLTQCQVGYKTRTGRNVNTDLKLQIVPPTGESHFIDASPLGSWKFHDMFAAMEKLSITTP